MPPHELENDKSLIDKWLDYFIQLNEEHFRFREQLLVICKLSRETNIPIGYDAILGLLNQNAIKINELMDKNAKDTNIAR